MTEPNGPPDLWRLAIVLRQPGATMQFTFSGENMARKAYGRLTTPDEHGACEIEDQYGNHARIVRADIMATILTHVSEDLKGSAELALAQAREQARTQRLAQGDLAINSPIARPAISMPRG